MQIQGEEAGGKTAVGGEAAGVGAGLLSVGAGQRPSGAMGTHPRYSKCSRVTLLRGDALAPPAPPSPVSASALTLVGTCE